MVIDTQRINVRKQTRPFPRHSIVDIRADK